MLEKKDGSWDTPGQIEKKNHEITPDFSDLVKSVALGYWRRRITLTHIQPCPSKDPSEIAPGNLSVLYKRVIFNSHYPIFVESETYEHAYHQNHHWLEIKVSLLFYENLKVLIFFKTFPKAVLLDFKR